MVAAVSKEETLKSVGRGAAGAGRWPPDMWPLGLAGGVPAIEVAAKAECWVLRAVADAGYAIPGPPASALGPVFAPSTTLASNSLRLRRWPTSMSFNEESTSSSTTSSSRDRCCSAEGCGVLAQWVPLHAVSCSNLIETGGCAESREIPLRVTR